MVLAGANGGPEDSRERDGRSDFDFDQVASRMRAKSGASSTEFGRTHLAICRTSAKFGWFRQSWGRLDHSWPISAISRPDASEFWGFGRKLPDICRTSANFGRCGMFCRFAMFGRILPILGRMRERVLRRVWSEAARVVSTFGQIRLIGPEPAEIADFGHILPKSLRMWPMLSRLLAGHIRSNLLNISVASGQIRPKICHI